MWSIPIFQVVSVITAKPLEVEFVKADLDNRILSAERSYIFRQMIVYLPLKDRILSAMIVYVTTDPVKQALGYSIIW